MQRVQPIAGVARKFGDQRLRVATITLGNNPLQRRLQPMHPRKDLQVTGQHHLIHDLGYLRMA
ncbi:hypothetical protein D3C78_1570560 [compost metagenome]